jgi:nucleoside-diphosphate-sugar epimerase
VKRPVVVTGASGFIGRHLTAHLARQDVPVIALSRKDVASSIGFKVQRISDYSDFQPPSGAVLVHLAEPPHIASVDADGDGHIARMKKQAAALLEHAYERAIYVSSAAVYGDRESLPRAPGEHLSEVAQVYGRAKLIVEALFLERNGVVARATNIFGRGMSPGTIFGDILSQLGGSGSIAIRETTPVRDYLWVEDAAEALGIMACGTATGTYNLASGRGISCENLAKLILRLDGQPDREVVGRLRPRESVLLLDISSTIREFGWVPRTTLEAGIEILLRSGRK